MKKIRRAIVSVSDKGKLKSILRILKKYNVKVISSGGTYKEIKKLGYKSIDISKFTGSLEILDGRVKTLHPKVHAGILNKRSNKNHNKEMKINNFEMIDLIIVNFYPFEKTLAKTKKHNKIIDNIDIGGPAMVRAAAKNYNDVVVITKIDQYEELIAQLKINKGGTNIDFRQKLSEEAFLETASYDAIISNYINKKNHNLFPKKKIILWKFN